MQTVSQQDIVNKASELITANPKITQQEALARAIADLTGCTVARPKSRGMGRQARKAKSSTQPKQKENEPPPEHVLRNIQRVKEAEVQRKKTGGSLPTARFVSGGKVSAK
jgi:hypothetical protein